MVIVGEINTGYSNDTRVCPNLDGALLSADSERRGSDWWVLCHYDETKIQSYDAMAGWLNTFGRTASWSDTLMPKWCTVRVNTCPIDPISEERFPVCSRFVSVAADGEICRNWTTGVTDNKAAWSAMRNYCLTYQDAPDCQCINASRDPNFSELRTQFTLNPYCWWIPCSQSTQLVPRDDYPVTACDKVTICSIVNRFANINQSRIDFRSLRQKVVCAPEGPSDDGGFWSQYGLWIIIGLGVLVLLIILLLWWSSRSSSSGQ